MAEVIRLSHLWIIQQWILARVEKTSIVVTEYIQGSFAYPQGDKQETGTAAAKAGINIMPRWLKAGFMYCSV